MKVTAKKLTDIDLMRRACEMTMHGQQSKISLDKIYLSEHSPARTQLFWVEMHDIPTFVSVHLVRHSVGIDHYVLSNRSDRGGDDRVHRNSPVSHGMLLNAQTIINISKERLCFQASKETREVWQEVLKAISKVDPALVNFCVPKCQYRQMCPEPRGCGWFK